MKTFIVPVDATDLSERAVPVAGALAEAASGEVVLLSVASAHDISGQTAMYLESLHERLPAGTPAADFVLHDDDSVARAILREAADRPAPIVVMASHGRSTLGTLVLGSVAEDVVRSAPFPVVLVGPRCATAWAPRLVVVAVDGSPATDGVLDFATEWAAATDAQIAVVHVLTPIALEGGSVVEGSPGLAEKCARRLRTAGAWASATTLESASPPDALVRWATQRGTSLIVIGSERRDRLQRAVFGSVSMGVVRHANCPVVVVGEPLAP